MITKNKFCVVEFQSIDSWSLSIRAYCETIADAKNRMKAFVKQDSFRIFAVIEVKELSPNAKSNIEDKIKRIDGEICQLELQKNNLLEEIEKY